MTGFAEVSEDKESAVKTVKVTVRRIATDECTVEVEVTDGMTGDEIKEAAREAACQLENDSDFSLIDTEWEIDSDITKLAKNAGVALAGADDDEEDDQ